MHDKFSDIINLSDENEHEKAFNFRNLLKMYLYHWPLFLVGLVICLLGAFIYLQKSNTVYNLTATVTIKDEKKESGEKSNLQEITNSNSTKLVENETEVLKSRNLIGQVVSDLQLWVNYKEKKGMKEVTLYDESPVVFTLLGSPADIKNQTLHIQLNNNKTFSLLNDNGKVQEFSFNDIQKSEFGRWSLKLAPDVKDITGKEVTIEITNPEKTAEQYQNIIKAEQVSKLASIINLTLKDEVEKRGKDVLNHLITIYTETSVTEKNQTTKRTLDFIDERINSLAGELNASEKNIEGFRSSRGITDISAQSQVYLQNVQANDNKLNEVNVQLNVLGGVDKYLKSPQNSQYIPSTMGIEEPVLSSSIERLSQLQLQREKLLATTPETSPDFEPIDRQIKTTKSSIKENLENIRSSLTLTKSKLQSFNSQYESAIRNVPAQERQLIDKTRQQSIKENLYVYLLQKREEVALNYSSILSDARIVDSAYATSKSSKKPLIYGLALLMSFLLPAGFLYGRTAFSDKITDSKEIKDKTSVPIITEISSAHNFSSVVTPGKNNMIVSEDFRKLRTGLNLLKNKSEKGWVTLITSSISNEGKSFVSSNLGYFLALSGKKTIVLEMDWRRPKISGIFELPASHSGMSDYLSGKRSIAQIIQKSSVQSGLDLIASGPLPSNPSELLESEEIDHLIQYLRSRYDYIILDTPPVNLVTDAKILSRFSDTTLYVVRQGHTFKQLLNYINDLSKEDQFENMRIVFNGIERGRYGYGDDYGKDYYEEVNPKKIMASNFKLSKYLKRF